MKSPLRFRYLVATIGLLACAMCHDVQAQFTFANDSADNYSGTWNNGSNQGTGFGGWGLSAGTSSGSFIGNPNNNGISTTAMGTTAFGLYSTGSGYINASRGFSTGLQVGDSFTFDWGINWDANGGSKGFDLKSGSTILLTVLNSGGVNVPTISGGSMGTIDSSYGTGNMAVTITRTTTGYNFSMTRRSNGSTFTGTFGGANDVLDNFNFFDGNQNDSNGNRNMYFDNLKVTNSGVFNQGGSITYSRALTGSGALTVTNSTTLILAADGSTFTGGSTVFSGSTLQIGNGGGGGDIAGNITNNGTVTFNRNAGTLAYSGVISGSGGVTKNGLGGQITLSGANTYSGKTIINGGTISIAADSGLGTAPSSVVTDQLQFGGGTLAVSSGFTLNSNRGITLNSGGGTIDVSALQTLSYGGIIAGTNSLAKAGSGILTLTGANSYSGATQITAGTVNVNTGGTLGNGNSDVTISSGAILNVNTSLAVGSVKETASSNGGVIAIGAGASFTINGANKGSLLQNSISGSGNLTMAGSGTTSLSLYGSQGYTGTTTVSGGKISSGVALSSTAYSLTGGTLETTAANVISDTASITLGGGTLSIGGTETFGNNGVTLTASTTSTVSPTTGITATVIGNVTGSGNISKSGSGQLNLSGNNDYSGTTTVTAGSLEVQSANALGSTAAGTTVNNGAELRLWNSTGVTVAAEGLTLNGDGIGSAGALRNISGVNNWQGAITNAGNARINSDSGTLTISGNISNNANQTLYVGGAGNIVLSGNLTMGAVSAGNALFLDTSSTTTISGNNSGLTGTVRIAGSGTILVGSANATGSGELTVAPSITPTIASSDGTARTLGNSTFNIYNNSLTLGQASGGTGSLTFGAVNLGNDTGAGNTRTITTASGTSHTFGAMSGNTGNTLIKAGSGSLALTGSSTTSGGIRIDDGTLSIANGASLGTGSIRLASNATTATLRVDSDATISNRLEVNNSSTAGVINVASGTTTTVSGILSQTNGTVNTTKFGKDGAGTLVFNNAGGTYNGQIQIGQGTVVVGATGALGSNQDASSARGVDLGLNVGDVVTSTDASLLAANGVTVAQSIYVAATNSNSKRTIGISGSGTNTFSNEIRLESGSSLTVNAGSSSSDRVNITGSITPNNATNASSHNLIKEGAGTLALSGTNTYTGTTTINAGTLKLERLSGGVGAASVTGSTIAVNSGGTLLLGAANQIGDTTGITMSGGATLDTAGLSDAVGRLAFSGSGVSATIKGLASGNNGSFIFNDIDTATIGNVAAGGLVFTAATGQSYDFNNGFRIKLFSTDISSTLTSNNFSQKVSFGVGQQTGAISFSGGTSATYLEVAAIPEPKVYAAAAILTMLIGFAEYRRRQQRANKA